MTAMSKKAFAFASQGQTAKAKQKVIGAFSIGTEDFEIVEQGNAGLAYLVYDLEGAEPQKVIATVLAFTERALTLDSAARFKKVVLGAPGKKGLELEEVTEVFQYILQVISGDVPPTSPGASSTRRRKTTTV